VIRFHVLGGRFPVRPFHQDGRPAERMVLLVDSGTVGEFLAHIGGDHLNLLPSAHVLCLPPLSFHSAGRPFLSLGELKPMPLPLEPLLQRDRSAPSSVISLTLLTGANRLSGAPSSFLLFAVPRGFHN